MCVFSFLVLSDQQSNFVVPQSTNRFSSNCDISCSDRIDLYQTHLMLLTGVVSCRIVFVYLVRLLFPVFQNHEFPGETELPPGLRGCNQQADQPGAVCLLRLPVYGKSSRWTGKNVQTIEWKTHGVTSGDNTGRTG